MYLNRIELNAKRRTTMRALAMPQLLHGAIEDSFPGERRRNLWRIDWLGEKCFLLVLSEIEPNFSNLVEQFGYMDKEPKWETKNYDSFLSKLSNDQILRFRLRANPVHAVKDNVSQDRGKIHAHVTVDQQKKWLMARANALGFSLNEDSFDVVHSEWKRFSKGRENNRRVSLHAVSFEGILTIIDVERFRNTLKEGAGRGKAYGLGMMTVIKP